MARLIDGRSPENVARFIDGLHYPALKNDVIHAARHNGAPAEMVERLQEVPITEFPSVDAVLAAYGEME
ncbi:MAG: DUF2795 domain-containing protein [Gemmataceae bacterium]|nr:DUF2795 domain-containing protein [Gemmataceae bacterium]